MPWVESSSAHFRARHEAADEEDVAEVLELLEATRERLEGPFGAPEHEVEVVVHPSRGALWFAQPHLPAAAWLTAPAARRYVAGGIAGGTIHLLAPRLLAARASSVPGSRELALLAPAQLYARLALVRTNHRVTRSPRWSWLAAGTAQFFSGQVPYARPAIARRLREGSAPAFPPTPRDALLLGGSVLDLLAAEHGDRAAVALATAPPPRGRHATRRGLERAFAGRELVHTEGAWRAHLARLAGMAPQHRRR